jgi:hypothetical protein
MPWVEGNAEDASQESGIGSRESRVVASVIARADSPEAIQSSIALRDSRLAALAVRASASPPPRIQLILGPDASPEPEHQETARKI